MSMSALVLILVIVMVAAIIVFYAIGEKFKSAFLAVVLVAYLTYTIMTLL